MPQPVLRTERLVLEPLADHHLDLEIDLDSDPEVLRYLSRAAHTPEQTRARHAVRMARGREIDGLGMWMGFLDWTAGPWMRRRSSASTCSPLRTDPASRRCRGWPTSATGSAATAGGRGSLVRARSSSSDTPSGPSAWTG